MSTKRPPDKGADTLPRAPVIAAAAQAAEPGRAGWLDNYPVEISGGDLFGDAAEPVAQVWRGVAKGLAGLGDGDPAALQDAASRHAVELGLTFRIAGDEQERDWPLNAMPLLISAQEWAVIERGLIQRAELLEELAADVYGPQKLVAEGHLPAAVVAGSPFFARKMLGRTPKGGHFIQLYAADLARGPRGQWRVLQDRLRIASGIGYALENRLVMTRAAGDVLGGSHVRRLAGFFADLRAGVAASCGREQPRIALLTPGRFNQTYAEQAHLARYLGLPLVEGRDLSVLNDKLYIGTIAGPKRVDALWRWINTNALDPLAFDVKSQLGVANLFEAWASGGVEMVNWPGIEVLESPAFSAFIPRLCRILTGGPLILPNIATWWCGQAAEASTVVARLDEMTVQSAFGQPVEGLSGRGAVAGAALDEASRKALLEAIWRRPMDYCGQEIVSLSTTPAIIDGEVVPCPFTVRAFVARTADGQWKVMPGGFARLSSSNALPTSMMGAGDLSADVWVIDQGSADKQGSGLLTEEPPISRGGGILASQAADNLFWFGRYNERAEYVVRLVRTMLGSSIELDEGARENSGTQRLLAQLLVQIGAIEADMVDASPVEICAQALTDMGRTGSVSSLLRRRLETGLSLRERFARDFWRIVSRPYPPVSTSRPQDMLEFARKQTENFSALAGLISENMVRSAAWRFLEMGQRIERAQGLCRMAGALSAEPRNRGALGALLDLCDSQIVYRSRYLTGPMANPVRDLVLLDQDNPRALVSQVEQIAAHLIALPSGRDDNLPELPLRTARALIGELQSATAQDMTMQRVMALEVDLLDLSDAISLRYFLQVDRDQPAARTRLM